MSIESVARVIHRSSIGTTVTTGFSKENTTVNCQLTVGDRVDDALSQTADLISAQFKAWYAQQAYRLGVDRYLGIASDARRGRSPKKLFSYLLRRAAR